ncbi:MAG TPA: hypothetical protein DHV36_19940 [Desulfobacteraceae bacterium]|nr:hypothetical protein [Desulfobacteraceae bacterium]|tara:strand:- start:1962 stop:2378 length:417 start_codon:yes stop_codon:yes gene_type:complete
MTRFYGALVSILLAALVVLGCGSDGSSKAESIIKDQADATENYVNGISSAESSQEVVAAIDRYTEDMKKLIPELKEFQMKYPEYKHGNIPKGMESDIKRLEDISAQIPEAMMKIASYMMDGDVQSAMQRMGEEMSKLE